MKRTRSSPALSKARLRIASEVRVLRRARGWTLEELAKRLDVSTSRLSDIERGDGSFTAEQFLEILALFNVPATHFSPTSRDPAAEQLQNALARFGATNLYESGELTPSEHLHSVQQVIREALIDGSPRSITAIAPVLVRNVERINPAALINELAVIGYTRRLGWVVDNTLAALDGLPIPNGRERLAAEHARSRLAYLSRVLSELAPHARSIEDVLDRTIRSERTLEKVRRDASPISRSWNIVTTLQPADFLEALRASLADH